MDVKITESRNPLSMNIDKMETEKILNLMNDEDKKVISAVKEEIPQITKAIDLIVPKMGKGGRLFYVGAGTSGRLGVLDAVECVPTFSINEGIVVGILAGGEGAMFRAREDIEDNYEFGAQEIRKYQLNELDTLIGIAASGNTPFVLGAVAEAKKRGSLTASLVCNKDALLNKEVDIAITPVAGPEVITGSTRMKAGTAQKLVLNMISSTVMIKLNKVYENLMVDLKATNNKLRERAKSIFMTVTGSDYTLADKYVKMANYNVKLAIIMYKKECKLTEAEKLLTANKGNLRDVIG